MNVKDAYNYLDEAVSASRLESFMVFGGEPMLYPNQAITILEKANKLRIPSIDMITNGFWGKDKNQAEKFAVKLKSAGLNMLSISVDAFHQQYIPIEYPKNAALASVNTRIENVLWNVTVVEDIDAENEYDKRTKQILKALEPVGIEAHIHKIIPVGRAARNLRGYLQQETLSGPCTGDPFLGSGLINPDCITIELSGEADICWHLPIGNAKKEALSRIISQYDWRKDVVIKTLVKEGPTGLLKLPEAKNFRFNENQHVSKCQFCMEIRKTLSQSF
jgi:MoaA/NifB/PqqE/SkfB family radical SAM enzyme